MVRAGPLTDRLKDGYDRASFFSQTVFNPRRNFIKLFTLNHVIVHQFFQRRRQDSIGNIGHLTADRTVAQPSLFGQHTEDP